MMLVAFWRRQHLAVYTFIGLFVTNGRRAFIDPKCGSPLASFFGIGMTTGGIGGAPRRQDWSRGLIVGFSGSALIVLAALRACQGQCRISDDWSLQRRHDDDDRHSIQVRSTSFARWRRRH